MVEIDSVLDIYELIKVKVFIDDCEIKVLIFDVIVCEIKVEKF